MKDYFNDPIFEKYLERIGYKKVFDENIKDLEQLRDRVVIRNIFVDGSNAIGIGFDINDMAICRIIRDNKSIQGFRCYPEEISALYYWILLEIQPDIDYAKSYLYEKEKAPICKYYEKKMIDAKMKKYNCPICGKELIRLEPYEDGVYNFWCDTCNIDICITNNNEVEKAKKEDFKNRVDSMIEYHDANARLITINKILYNETLDKYFKNYHGFNKRNLTSDTITYYHDCDTDEGFNKEYVIKVEPERDRIYISKLEKYKSDKVTKPIFVRSWNIGNLYSEDIDYLVNRIIDLCLGPDYAHKHAKEVGKRFEDE